MVDGAPEQMPPPIDRIKMQMKELEIVETEADREILDALGVQGYRRDFVVLTVHHQHHWSVLDQHRHLDPEIKRERIRMAGELGILRQQAREEIANERSDSPDFEIGKDNYTIEDECAALMATYHIASEAHNNLSYLKRGPFSEPNPNAYKSLETSLVGVLDGQRAFQQKARINIMEAQHASQE